MVVDIDLSALGPMQFDGLYNNQRFDLFVRSRTRLAAPMRHDILTIFDDAIAHTGLKGKLGFQVMGDFPVAPADDLARRLSRELVL
jgi:hypothetical protein